MIILRANLTPSYIILCDKCGHTVAAYEEDGNLVCSSCKASEKATVVVDRYLKASGIE